MLRRRVNIRQAVAEVGGKVLWSSPKSHERLAVERRAVSVEWRPVHRLTARAAPSRWCARRHARDTLDAPPVLARGRGRVRWGIASAGG
jgi:hypothetical protein